MEIERAISFLRAIMGLFLTFRREYAASAAAFASATWIVVMEMSLE